MPATPAVGARESCVTQRLFAPGASYFTAGSRVTPEDRHSVRAGGLRFSGHGRPLARQRRRDGPLSMLRLRVRASRCGTHRAGACASMVRDRGDLPLGASQTGQVPQRTGVERICRLARRRSRDGKPEGDDPFQGGGRGRRGCGRRISAEWAKPPVHNPPDGGKKAFGYRGAGELSGPPAGYIAHAPRRAPLSAGPRGWGRRSRGSHRVGPFEPAAWPVRGC